MSCHSNRFPSKAIENMPAILHVQIDFFDL